MKKTVPSSLTRLQPGASITLRSERSSSLDTSFSIPSVITSHFHSIFIFIYYTPLIRSQPQVTLSPRYTTHNSQSGEYLALRLYIHFNVLPFFPDFIYTFSWSRLQFYWRNFIPGSRVAANRHHRAIPADTQDHPGYTT